MTRVPVTQNKTLSFLGGHLDHSIVRNAYTGIKAEHTSVTIENCVIENSLQSGIEADLATNQTLRLHNCSVRNNRRKGLLTRGTDGQYTVGCINSTFTSNGNTGVHIERSNIIFIMVNCRLENNTWNLKAYPLVGVFDMHGCFFGPHSHTYNFWSAAISMSNHNDYKASMV